jgi:hypothetical protein
LLVRYDGFDQEFQGKLFIFFIALFPAILYEGGIELLRIDILRFVYTDVCAEIVIMIEKGRDGVFCVQGYGLVEERFCAVDLAFQVGSEKIKFRQLEENMQPGCIGAAIP